MNCKKCQLLLYEYIDGSLSEDIQSAIENHLQSCCVCSEYFQQQPSLHTLIKKQTHSLTLPDISSKVDALANAPKKPFFIHIFTSQKIKFAAVLLVLGAIFLVVFFPKKNKAPQKEPLLFKVHKTEFFYENTEKNYSIKIVE